MTLSAENRANLERLAAHLEKLPVNYARFDMSDYTSLPGGNGRLIQYALHNGGLPGCGAVACAVGHGPAAGILVPEDYVRNHTGYGVLVDWGAYEALFTGGDMEISLWLFASLWSEVDNTARGAAARIRYVLDRGWPPGDFEWPESLWCEAYAPYRIDAKAKADA